MRQLINLEVPYSVAYNPVLLKKEIHTFCNLKLNDDTQYQILKRSIDARSKHIKINLKIEVYINEPIQNNKIVKHYFNVTQAKKEVVIIGAGPAGLFAALRCLELGLKPIVFERGKPVQERRRDLAAIFKQHIINEHSNYCFGEGGAGTYSDGKLYTRSNKRGDINNILETFIYHGAHPDIAIDAHPHIGTNKLPQIITNIKNTILEYGGEVHFNSQLIDINIKQQTISSIQIQNTLTNIINEIHCQNILLATGHSARDIYYLLNKHHILLEAKPFALGVRVEHPQIFIDSIQYKCSSTNELLNKRQLLPPSAYNLTHQSKDYPVYSFCMCPGGIIAPCATGPKEVVTNGWSPSKRNNVYANSGIVVGLNTNDYKQFDNFGPLSGLELQKEFEHKAWIAGGKNLKAPAQNLSDFMQNKISPKLIESSYNTGTTSVNLNNVLGKKITQNLQQAFTAFDQKMKGFISNDAIVVGVESRTSTPVKIPRDKETLQHIQIKNLYPCAEGAGYAGGIMSAAMDGINCVDAIERGG